MPTPTFIDLPADTWTKIATDISVGQVHLVDTTAYVIRSTYVQPSGGTAPANDQALGVPAFQDGTTERMASNSGSSMDVYLRPEGVDSQVRVDI